MVYELYALLQAFALIMVRTLQLAVQVIKDTKWLHYKIDNL